MKIRKNRIWWRWYRLKRISPKLRMGMNIQISTAKYIEVTPYFYRKTSSAVLESTARAAKQAAHHAKQTRAFEQLDKMMEEILDDDIPGMCTFSFGPPPKSQPKPPKNSKSDGNIVGGGCP